VRRGVTLTEILIAIMILGIGLVSLATLFPIGLLRLREAQRYSRSAFLAQSAGADIASRRLLSKTKFFDPSNINVCPWYSEQYYDDVQNKLVPLYTFGYDPWIQDTPSPTDEWLYGLAADEPGTFRGTGGRGQQYPNQTNDPTGKGLKLDAVPGPGLPVAYDPLWWYRMQRVPDPLNGVEFRFASGITVLGADASAAGLQRVTNLDLKSRDTAITNAIVRVPSIYNANMILSTFISPEDVVWQEASGEYADFQNPTTDDADLVPLTPGSQYRVSQPSPVVPDLYTSYAEAVVDPTRGSPFNQRQPTVDWRYTCMFVGQQTDSYNGRMFDGDVVVFENRPFGLDPVPNTDPQLYTVAGERVVQAVFGYGTKLVQVGQMLGDSTVVALPQGSNNAVLLLWPSTVPDLEIKAGSWIADVTYERRHFTGQSRFRYLPDIGAPAPPPAQRCYWYQVQRATAPADTAGTPFATFGAGRYALVYTSTDLRAKTLWDSANGVPYHLNAALVSPYVVAVAPRTIAVP